MPLQSLFAGDHISFITGKYEALTEIKFALRDVILTYLLHERADGTSGAIIPNIRIVKKRRNRKAKKR